MLIHHWNYEVYNTAVLWSFWRFTDGAKIKIYHPKTIWVEFCEHSVYFLSNCLARERRVNLFEAVSLRSTVPVNQSSAATFSQMTETSFVCKLFDKLFRSMNLSWRKTLMKTLSSSLNAIVSIVYPTVAFYFFIYGSYFYSKFCVLLSN